MSDPSSSVCDSAPVEVWKPEPSSLESDLLGLAEVLFECVQAGASVGFVQPFSRADARAFWRDSVLPGVREGSRRVLTARVAGTIAGTVQLELATPPNQKHRADVKKLLVHPRHRGHGLARQLMREVEAVARKEHRWLLTLDTVAGGVAEQLYRSLGYVAVGSIPQYALNATSTLYEATTILYKSLPKA